MRADVRELLKMNPRSVIVAVAVSARLTRDEFQKKADEIICLRTPEPFQAVGVWYGDFTQTTDKEVHELLDKQ